MISRGEGFIREVVRAIFSRSVGRVVVGVVMEIVGIVGPPEDVWLVLGVWV